MRLGLHPQLEAEYGRTSYSDYYGRNTMAAGMNMNVAQQVQEEPMYDRAASSEMPMPASAPAPMEQKQMLESIQVTGSRLSKESYAPRKLKRYASNTMIQAGGGEPSWNWRSYSIELAGPVLPTQEVKLWLSPPWLTRLARFAIATLFVLIALHLARAGFGWVPKLPLRRASAAALALALLGLGGAVQAQDLPDAELIKELRERLPKTPDCTPTCGPVAMPSGRGGRSHRGRADPACGRTHRPAAAGQRAQSKKKPRSMACSSMPRR
ncbi:MAG: hypothetical protein IPH76_14620 [Xanthomonadales bacterium]|nr:hypothetical protein [Xanthomonadales bacterium]